MAIAAQSADGAELFSRLVGRGRPSYYKPTTAYQPVPDKHPYYGEALGATYYRWGHFGAQEHPFLIERGGYYGDHWDVGTARGY
jgi:hypothetical protein